MPLWHRPASGNEARLEQCIAHGAEVLEAVGVDPQRDRVLLGVALAQQLAKFGVRSEGLVDWLAEVLADRNQHELVEHGPLPLGDAAADRHGHYFALEGVPHAKSLQRT